MSTLKIVMRKRPLVVTMIMAMAMMMMTMTTTMMTMATATISESFTSCVNSLNIQTETTFI